MTTPKQIDPVRKRFFNVYAAANGHEYTVEIDPFFIYFRLFDSAGQTIGHVAECESGKYIVRNAADVWDGQRYDTLTQALHGLTQAAKTHRAAASKKGDRVLWRS